MYSFRQQRERASAKVNWSPRARRRTYTSRARPPPSSPRALVHTHTHAHKQRSTYVCMCSRVEQLHKSDQMWLKGGDHFFTFYSTIAHSYVPHRYLPLIQVLLFTITSREDFPHTAALWEWHNTILRHLHSRVSPRSSVCIIVPRQHPPLRWTSSLQRMVNSLWTFSGCGEPSLRSNVHFKSKTWRGLSHTYGKSWQLFT